jgi:hypothetical protein
MRALGVSYYLTHGGRPAADAASTAGLTSVERSGRWEVWEVAGSETVVALSQAPAVVEGVSTAEWDEVTSSYFVAPTFDTIPIAESGPEAWPRIGLSELPPAVAVPGTTVSGIQADADSVSFQVSAPGSPVWVKVSAFPGWEVEGADVAYRASPNFIVVVPTGNSVRVTRVRTVLDVAALSLALMGLVLIALAGLRRLLRRRG